MVQEVVDMLKNYYALTVSKRTVFGSFLKLPVRLY